MSTASNEHKVYVQGTQGIACGTQGAHEQLQSLLLMADGSTEASAAAEYLHQVMFNET